MRFLCRLVAIALSLAPIAFIASPAPAATRALPSGVTLVAHAVPFDAEAIRAFPQIIGGTDAAAGAIPYAVYIQADYLLNGVAQEFTCTGSLIAPTIVLTAGHCAFDESTGIVIPPNAYSLALGLSDLTTIPAGNVRTVSQVIPYPYFNPDTLQGDAALLRLSSNAPSGAAPIALASAANAALYAPGMPVTVAGWGLTSNASGAMIPAHLQVATEAVQANTTCDAAVPGYHPAFDLCAASAGYRPSICNGDSGGALVAGAVEIGIVSYYGAPLCGDSPDYYTRVSSIQPWVASVLAGSAAPAAFVPPFVAPTPVAALSADGVTISWPTPLADPSTQLTGFVVALVNAAGAVTGTQTLPATATSAVFPSLQPTSYAAAVIATYTEGNSATAATAGVTLNPPANTRAPAIAGRALVGSTLTCQTGTWAWPGASTISIAWLRNGIATGTATPTYRVGPADGGKHLSCVVTLRASTGSSASAASSSLFAGVKLKVKAAPHIAGTPTLGKTLTCLAGTWAHSGALKLTYDWLRNAKSIARARGKSSTHTITAADIGKKLACRVTATATGQTTSATTTKLTV